MACQWKKVTGPYNNNNNNNNKSKLSTLYTKNLSHLLDCITLAYNFSFILLYLLINKF